MSLIFSSIMFQQAFIFLTWIMFANAGELIMTRNQDNVYCMGSAYTNRALTWIPKIEKRYDEDVTWMPANEDVEEFRILNCNLMKEGGCPIWEKINETWEIIEHAGDEYGFIHDHRWNSLPLYTTTGNHSELKNVSGPLSEKGRILMSILAKNNAYLTVTDGEKGFNITLDARIRDGERRSVSYCPRNKGLHCDDKELNFTSGAILNDREEWRDIMINLHRHETELLIQIDSDAPWQIPYTLLGNDTNIGHLKHIFLSTGNSQIGFWKFHHYRALRLIKPGFDTIFAFKTRNSTQLCLSILYHSGSTQQQLNGIAATVKMIDVSASNQILSDQIKAGSNWQEYRKVIYNLNTNNAYEIILGSTSNYKHFAIGEIRVCHEKEHLIARTSEENNDLTCSFLNSTTKTNLRKTEDQQFIYECPKGSFGDNCDIQCSNIGFPSCENLQVCNAKVCSCLPGYYGETCEYECKGKYGIKCQTQCHHCRDGSQCNFVNGSCPNFECDDGYHPGNNGFCSDKCQQGTYGYNCEKKCSNYCKISKECDHISGNCTGNECSLEFYERSSCQYPRFILSKPEVLKQEVNRLVLSIFPSGTSGDSKFIKEIAVQYRIHQLEGTADWEEGPRSQFSETLDSITLPGLAANTTYDVRVILYDEHGVGNVGTKVPILPNVTTLTEEIKETADNCEISSSDIIKAMPIYIALLLCVSSLPSFQ